MRHIFVYRPGAIGDTILALPALAALRGRCDPCRITFAGNAAMLPLIPAEETISADDVRLLPLFADKPEPWPHADMHVIFARQPVGLRGIQRDPLDAVGRRVHMADWLVDAIDPDWQERTPRVHVVPLAVPLKEMPIVIHPGAGSPAKRWPAEKFARLAEALEQPVAVVRGPADEPLELEMPHDIWDSLPLPDLARRLAGSALFVGNDSGISHLAAAVGTPSVAVYLSTDATIWGIRGAGTRRLEGDPNTQEVLETCRELLAKMA